MSSDQAGQPPSFEHYPERLPPYPPDDIDPAAREFLTGTDWEQVPGARDFVVTCSAWRREIVTGVTPPEGMAGIHRAFAWHEQAQGDTHTWDMLRAYLGSCLFMQEQREDSLDVIAGMRSLRLMAETTDRLADLYDAPTYSAIVAGLRDRLQANSERFYGLAHASYGFAVGRSPDTEGLDELEALVAATHPSHDPVKVWVEFVQQAVPSAEGLEEFVRDNNRWHDIPMRERQHVTAAHYDIVEMLRSPEEETVQAIIQDLTADQASHPEAMIWDDLRLIFGASLVRNQYPDFAVAFGRTMQAPLHQQSLVVVLKEHSYEQEALTLTYAMTDPTIFAMTLAHGNWTNDQGIDLLFEIVNDPENSIELRLACALALRDEAHRRGRNTDRYSEVVIFLETQQGEERPET